MIISKTSYPVRLPVKWYFVNSPKGKIKNVVIEFDKDFNMLEKLISGFFKSPKILRRPLDDMNSRLWIMMNGENNFENILKEMELIFKERIIPVNERVSAYILKFRDLGLATVVNSSEEIVWNLDSVDFH